jgi:hypothetical protein
MEGLKFRSRKSATVARTSMLGDMVRPSGGGSSSFRRRRRNLSLIAMCEVIKRGKILQTLMKTDPFSVGFTPSLVVVHDDDDDDDGKLFKHCIWTWFSVEKGGAQSTAIVEAATAETVERVVSIVATQLGTSSGTIHPHSRFQELGADSLDQVNQNPLRAKHC